MKKLYTLQTPNDPGPDSGEVLFLAGPTHRVNTLVSWRVEALELLESFGFDGLAVVPEFAKLDPEEKRTTIDTQDIWDWEAKWLGHATVILFWVPREMHTLPGLTTNIEFGAWQRSGKVVFGAPSHAESVGYMRHWCGKLGIPQADTLPATVHKALAMLQDKRHGVERTPLERPAMPLCSDVVF